MTPWGLRPIARGALDAGFRIYGQELASLEFRHLATPPHPSHAVAMSGSEAGVNCCMTLDSSGCMKNSVVAVRSRRRAFSMSAKDGSRLCRYQGARRLALATS